MSHVLAEDRGPESGAPVLSRTRGQMVHGYATFYVAANVLTKVPPGRLDLAEIHGGASGVGNGQVFGLLGSNLVRSGVEFYLYADNPRAQNFVVLDGRLGDVFTFGFFGRRFS